MLKRAGNRTRLHTPRARAALERRVPRPGRAGAGKVASLGTLRELNERYDLFSPVPGRACLDIENTSLAPAEVAGLITSHYHLPAARTAEYGIRQTSWRPSPFP